MGGYDEERGGTSDSIIESNTLYKNDLLGDGNGQLYLQANLRGNVITRNIIVAGDSGVMISNEYTSNSNNTLDGNLYYAAAGADQAFWVWKKRRNTPASPSISAARGTIPARSLPIRSSGTPPVMISG
ncbi:hypothetical protein ACFTAO_22425 [Paenibacillus rhizoplanae]